MNKPLSIIFSAIFGILLCVSVILVADSMHITPRFPAFAGEDDFSKRISIFVIFVCPAFITIGAWIGSVFWLEKQIAGFMWGGVIAGSVVTFSCAYLLSPFISRFSTSDASNLAVFALFFFWVALSALGGGLARAIFGESKERKNSK